MEPFSGKNFPFFFLFSVQQSCIVTSNLCLITNSWCIKKYVYILCVASRHTGGNLLSIHHARSPLKINDSVKLRWVTLRCLSYSILMLAYSDETFYSVHRLLIHHSYCSQQCWMNVNIFFPNYVAFHDNYNMFE